MHVDVCRSVSEKLEGCPTRSHGVNAKILTDSFPSCALPRVSPPNLSCFFLFSYILYFFSQRTICNSTSTRARADRFSRAHDTRARDQTLHNE